MGFQEEICRLCLEKCENFRIIEGDIKNALDILLPKIDYLVIQRPVVCRNCAKTLIKCYDLKARCLKINNYVVQFANNKDNVKLDLKDVYLSKHVIIGTGISEDHDICGFCMDLVKSVFTLSLNVEEGDVLEQMIGQCFPELDLTIIKKPVICVPCYESLKNCFHFVKNCFIVEEKIRKYYESLDIDSKRQIELSDLLQFTIRDVTTGKVDSGSSGIMKVENQLCVKKENTDAREIDSRGDITKLEPMPFDSSEDPSEDIENKNDFIEIKIQKVNDECQITPKNMLICEEESNKFGFVKKEETYGEHETKFKEENLVEMEDQQFLRNKEIEINIDEHKINRIEDGIVLTQSEDTNMLHQNCLMPNFAEDYSKPCINQTFMNGNISKIPLHQCERGPFQTRDKHCLKKHLPVHIKSPETTLYKCDFCPYETKLKYNVKNHLLVHKDLSEVTMHKCDTCTFWTKYKSSLKKHLLQHKDPSEVTMYNCEYCSFQTKQKHSMTNHLLVHKDPSEVKMHKCDYCSYQTMQKYHLARHLMLHKNPSEVTMYKCDTCSFVTKHKDSLKKHLLLHKDPSLVKMYKCDSCSFETKQIYSLKLHLLAHKDPSEVIMYKCDSCSYESKYKESLKSHIRVHKDPSELTMYKCDSCPFQTKYRDHMKKHSLVHKDPSEVTMYKCDFCSLQTKDKYGLKKHLLVHKDPSEVTMYKCESCSYQTKLKYSLKKHSLVHKDPSEVTMYKCDSCSYRTKLKYSLKKHLLMHKE